MKLAPLAFLVCSGWLPTCRSATEAESSGEHNEVQPSRSDSQAADAPLPARSPSKFACTVDEDCMNSCSEGAVSKAWYQAELATKDTCEDGCASKGMGPPRCLEDRCVAFDSEGNRDAYCTKER